MSAVKLENTAAAQVLREVFGYSEFRGLQAEIVDHVVAGGDALVLMPTGGGKSLTYQVPAIVRHRAGRGVALVVSPLIALMQDQVGALEEAGVHAAFLNSTLDGGEALRIERELRSGRLVLLYAAPERILTPRFLAMLDSLHERGLFSLVAIDEAHCVSQWGHDFREDYLGLTVFAERYAGVPRIALTATADDLTRADIVARLSLANSPTARTFVASFDRPNIRYTIVEKDEPKRQLLRLLQDDHTGEAGIVYCGTRKKVEETAEWLNAAGITALPYHAGLDAGVRERHQNRFLREDAIVMVATIAFGDGLAAEAWMAYGLQDVVNQRRMIDDSTGGEEFKRVQRGKLEALLALAEAADCRRVRLLDYFGEASQPCGNCDNCLNPPDTWEATDAARKLLSCIYLLHQSSGIGYGAAHLIDVLRGKVTDKVTQHRHERLSTFGVGADLDEARWRGVLRQLVALGHVAPEGEYNTLALAASARRVLKGEVPIVLRVPREALPRARVRKEARAGSSAGKTAGIAAALDSDAQQRFAALKAWRAAVAREHNLPAYIVFHDAALAAMAIQQPTTLDELGSISGVGAKKLEAYGREILRLLGGG